MSAKLSPLFSWRGEIVDSDLSANTRHIALTLSMHMSESGDSCFPSIRTLASESGRSSATVSEAIKELVDGGYLDVAHGGGRGKPNRYTAIVPGNVLPVETFLIAETLQSAVENVSTAKTEDVLPRERQRSRPTPPIPPPERIQVFEAWKSSAPPLIRHRDSYFQSPDTSRAVAKAEAKYPVPDVVVAIFNYATVLGGAEYRWDYSWTMVDFLKRGLDRFVPEARPLENFRVRTESGTNGKLTLTEKIALLPG